MKKLLALLAIILLMISCSSLRNKHTNQKLGIKKHLALQQSALATQFWQQNLLDSSTANIELTFWPKGVVKYSPANGFEGEATQIRLRHKKVQVTQLNENKQQQELKLSDLELKEEQQQVNKTNFKNKKRNYFWIFGFLILLSFLIYIGNILYRR